MARDWVWTEDRANRCAELWQEGHSASQIATIIGAPSRNSVISKISRMGLSFRGGSPAKRNVANQGILVRKAKARAKAKPKPVHMAYGNPIRTPMEAQPLPVARADDVARIRCLTDLEPHHCRWPVGTLGEDGFGFCGDRKLPGASYCSGHLLRAFAPIKTNDNKRQRATEDAARLHQKQKQPVEA